MKNFFKGLFAFVGIIAAAIGALAIVDKLMNRNRIEGDYLDCSSESEEDSAEQ
ncbi:MAG: hypothetical protein IKK24_01085 [Clostridia bacterium]|nr:hypothetical protein [Clostridia bacterium]